MNTLHDDARRASRLTTLALALALTMIFTACGKEGAKAKHAAGAAKSTEQAGAKKDDHAGEKEGERKEGEAELTLTSEKAARAGVKVEEVKARALGETSSHRHDPTRPRPARPCGGPHRGQHHLGAREAG